MDNRKRRTPSQQISDLGLNRYRLTPDEETVLMNYRDAKDFLEKECLKQGIDPKEVKHYWYKSKEISAFIKKKEKSIEDLKNEMMEGMSRYSPKFKLIKREKFKESYCLVIDPADVHIGKLAQEYDSGNIYNSKVAVERVLNGIDDIMKYVSAFNIDKIVLIIGNDILHTDTRHRTTTSGTPQDTEGQWYDNFMIARELYVSVIERLLPIADVHVMHDASNHDYMSGWYLAQVIQTWFRLCKNITFDTTLKHRKAFVYYNNLIGTTHNDGAKEEMLPLLMAQEFKQEWAMTEHRYIYVHHKHHKTSKDYAGVTVETVRSVSAADNWHHKHGYQHAPEAIEAYLHHKEKGQIIRFTSIVQK